MHQFEEAGAMRIIIPEHFDPDVVHRVMKARFENVPYRVVVHEHLLNVSGADGAMCKEVTHRVEEACIGQIENDMVRQEMQALRGDA